MVARLYPRHAFADFFDDPGCFVSRDIGHLARSHAFDSGEVGVTQPGRHDFDQNFTRAGRIEVDFLDFQRLRFGEGCAAVSKTTAALTFMA